MTVETPEHRACRTRTDADQRALDGRARQNDLPCSAPGCAQLLPLQSCDHCGRYVDWPAARTSTT